MELCAVLQCKEKPQGDKYGFTYFARMLNSGKGLAPLPSDSRRRPDRAALEVTTLLFSTKIITGPADWVLCAEACAVSNVQDLSLLLGTMS